MVDLLPITRALVSVSDKTGLIELAKALTGYGIELISTGGTAVEIRNAGLDVQEVSEVTGFPELLDGRVKTLHPNVHGALLGLRDSEIHMAEMEKQGIKEINLLIVNLYPFAETVSSGSGYTKCIENIDIGGPAMLRAAAKNYKFVNVITEIEDYKSLLDELEKNGGLTSYAFRRNLALAAYSRTASYDSAVANWLRVFADKKTKSYTVSGDLIQKLRYGENPHQAASFYKKESSNSGITSAKIWQGKDLSYNNINDADAAIKLVMEFDLDVACAIIKHANPCGVAIGKTLTDAYLSAFECDMKSAFGGIVAFNETLDEKAAGELIKLFTEVVIAPDLTEGARRVFNKKKNIRLLTFKKDKVINVIDDDIRSVTGGFLIQSQDDLIISASDIKVVTERQPSETEYRDLVFAWKVAKHVKSNAIVYAKDGRTVGIGAGQMSRVDSTRIAALKFQDMKHARINDKLTKTGLVLASDAFFPFSDGLITAVNAGVSAVIQPGGSMRDKEIIQTANELGISMIFTGRRHFRH
tara:strand:- start:1579 stop:3159 length:1581 start_codon:yes stop_codon:yes gene_type:complete